MSVAAGLLGYTLASNASKEFSASAIVEIVDPTQDVVSAGAKSGFDIDVQRQAVEVLLESPQVRAAVAAELGVAVEAVAPIDAEGAAGSALIGVRGVANTGADAERTADLAVALATEVQRQRLATEFQAVADKLKEDSAGLDDRIRELEGRIQSLDQAAAQAGIAAVVAPGQVATPAQIESGLVSKQQADEAAVARQQLATVFEQQLALEREAQQYELEATVRSPGFRPYRDAGLPKSSGPRPKQAAALAAAAGVRPGHGSGLRGGLRRRASSTQHQRRGGAHGHGPPRHAARRHRPRRPGSGWRRPTSGPASWWRPASHWRSPCATASRAMIPWWSGWSARSEPIAVGSS